MPIGDLLAQISGEKSQPGSTSVPRPSSASKRKADDDLRSSLSKTPRTGAGAGGSLTVGKSTDVDKQVKRDVSVGKPGTTPYKGSALSRAAEKTSIPPKALSGSAPKPLPTNSRSSNGLNGRKSALPGISQPNSSALTSKAVPKKGSYAEIMARAQRAQQSMGQVGKIQHKPVEKGSAKKEDTKIEPRGQLIKKTGKPHAIPRNSAALPPHHNGVGKNGHPQDPRRSVVTQAKDRQPKVEQQEKKVKKAAVATTGYSGTARPNPGSSKKKPAPGGALLNARSAPRYGGSSRRSRYNEEEDEELDDFIEYDDEEEEDGGPRYEYNSDASSDMEAGLDDIYEEEQRASYIAIQEDIKEERLERSLKAQKEARKRKFEEMRARSRR